MIWLKTDRVTLNSLLQKLAMKRHIGARLPVFLRRPGASETPVIRRLMASRTGSPVENLYLFYYTTRNCTIHYLPVMPILEDSPRAVILAKNMLRMCS